MTAGDAMRRLFEAIGEYARSTTPSPSEARITFARHRGGGGFTIDGSRRPGAPTRPGEQNSGTFLGLRSGHAIAEIRALKERIDSLLDAELAGKREGFDDSVVGFNECWDIVRAEFERILKGR